MDNPAKNSSLHRFKRRYIGFCLSQKISMSLPKMFNFLVILIYIINVGNLVRAESLRGAESLNPDEEEEEWKGDENKNITCRTCNPLEQDNPCDLEDIVPPDRRFLKGDYSPIGKVKRIKLRTASKCYRCALSQTWYYVNETQYGESAPRDPWRLRSNYRLCLVSLEGELGCSFEFPMSRTGIPHVIEICRCDTDLCNAVSFEKLGGTSDPKKFPPIPGYRRRKQHNSATHLNQLRSHLLLQSFVVLNIYFISGSVPL